MDSPKLYEWKEEQQEKQQERKKHEGRENQKWRSSDCKDRRST